MDSTKKYWVGVGIGLSAFVVVIIGLNHYMNILVAPPSANTSATTAVATTTDEMTPVAPLVTRASTTASVPFPINPADNIASFTFSGVYLSNDTLTAQTNADIVHLTSLLGGGTYDNYDLYNGIANDYALIGEGKRSYEYYNQAISIHPQKGLAYVNLAHLMSQLGAYQTAADAFKKAVTVEPGMLEYHVERLAYLTEQFPKETSVIERALTDVSKQFGDTPAILSIKARWLTGEKQYALAIQTWQTVKKLSPTDRQVAIDAEIARLQAKQ